MKIKTIYLTLIFIISSTGIQVSNAQQSTTPTAVEFSGSAASGSAPAMNAVGIEAGRNSAANGSYGDQNARRCNSDRPSACARAILGYAQMGLSLLQMLSTMQTRDALSPGTDWRTPIDPIDYDTLPPGSRDYLDPLADSIRRGNLSDFANLKAKYDDLSKKNIDMLNKMGYSFDADKGTITTPNGTQSMSSLASALGDGAGDYASKINDALGLKDSGSGPNGAMTAADQAAKAQFERNISSLDDYSKNSVDKFLTDLDKGAVNSKLTGMSVNTKEGDAIGVSMGNLFNMIHNKYRSLSSQQEFK